MTSVLIDSNIPMYLVGDSATHRVAAEQAVSELVAARTRLLTDAEVHQEILHRYRAIDRADAIQPAFDVLDGIVDEVLPVNEADVILAKNILLARWALSARDSLHVAVMQRSGIARILTFDRGFDRVPGIERINA